MSLAPEESMTAADAPQLPERRSLLIEIVGVVSAVCFFIGVFCAYLTFASGVVSQSEFECLEVGYSLAEVNDCLGFQGRQIAADTTLPDMPADNGAKIYRWENSSLSYVECEFTDGKLTAMTATQLP